MAPAGSRTLSQASRCRKSAGLSRQVGIHSKSNEVPELAVSRRGKSRDPGGRLALGETINIPKGWS